MNTRRIFGFLAVAATLATGTLPAANGADKLKIVTTTSDLRSLAEAVGGEKVEVASMGTGHEDPHFIDAKPSCMVLARDADLWIRIGLELEIGYEGLILRGARNPKILVGAPGHLDASAGVLRLEVPTTKIDRSLGDVHPMGNPHYWLDPLNARIVAKNIAQRLAKLDPADASYFRARRQAFQDRLDEAMFGPKLMAAAATVTPTPDQAGSKLWVLLLKGQLEAFAKAHDAPAALDGWWGAMLPLKDTPIVTYHRSWSYFAHRFGLRVIAELEPKPGLEPTPAHLDEVLRIVEAQKARFLLVEPFYSQRAPEWLASKTGIVILQVANSVGGQPEATDYIAMISNIVHRCVQAATTSRARTP